MPDGYTLEESVGRVDHVDGGVIYVRFPAGTVLSLREDEDEEERDKLAAGDTVLVHLQSGEVTKAPSALWVEKPWIGTVAELLDGGEAIIDVSGVLLVFPITPGVAVKVGYTVEGTHFDGVRRVLVEKPVRRVHELAEMQSDVSQYRFEPDDAPTYDDFGGYAALKERINELIELPLLHRDKLLKINAPTARGVLFTGPSGTGKTMLGRIIAGQAHAMLYLVSGPEIVGKYLGDSEKLVRDIFNDAEQHQPAIIFFDEIDSLAPQRGDDTHEASRRLVGQLLTKMDGYNKRTNVMVIATTNRPEDIDDALRRPGRFDWQVVFTLPDRDDREDILRKSVREMNVEGDLPHGLIADRTEGWSPAELAGIRSEAALFAIKDDRDAVTVEDYLAGFELAANQRETVAATKKTSSTSKESQ
ncbi:AAA family ATPase [Amycolatopsis sp. NPDC051102]|uniref:ATP-binding protein n=1 Tax=Amycolatopsis sp. NPDC051102 TaxID=3155163 RepID=UPI0034417716